MIEKQFVNQKIKEFQIQEYIKEEFSGTGFSHIDIQRTPLGEKVIIYTTRPGLVVGKKGENIRKLTIVLKKKFNMENPQIEIGELQDIINAGALGAEIVISGKVPSARSRRWRFKAGHLKKSGYIASDKVKKAITQAKLKSGIIGIKISIMTPDIILPDKILVLNKEMELVEKKPEEIPKETPEKEIKEEPKKKMVKKTKEKTEEEKVPEEKIENENK